MTASISPILVTIGSQVIDRSIVPIINTNPILISSYNLRPGGLAQYWMDSVNITNFVQPSSVISVNVGYNANSFDVQEGIYCPTTHAYAVVQENSMGTVLQVAENFHCINLSVYGSNTFTSTQYAANDIVYQANNTSNVYANTMIGRVAFWDYANGALAITVTSGTLNNVSTGNVLFKVGSTKLANVQNLVLGNKFPTGAPIVSVANTSKYFLANTYNPNHGLITQANVGSLLQVSGLSPNVNVVGQTIYITRGTGIGQRANIIAWNSATGYVTIDTTWGVAGDSYFGLGGNRVNGVGLCTGIMHIPADPNFNFQTGSRLVTVNDSLSSSTDNAASMRSTATFVAAGQLPTGTSGTPVVSPTPPLSPAANSTVAPSPPTSSSINNNGPINDPNASADPLVQTFFTPKSNQYLTTDYGCFATSVDLFFQSKPTGNSTQFPVSVYIVDTVNGFPTTNVIATSTVQYDAISITDGITTFPNSANSSTYTKFKFVDPVYLAPGHEYGIVIYSESPDYDVWVSQIGQSIINSTRLVSQSPYIGSFFESQNSSAWTPIQNQQLMFVLNKAVFSTTPLSMVFSVNPPTQNTYMDIATIHSADLTFPVATIQYGIQSTTANGGIVDTFKPVSTDVPFYYGGDLVNSSINSNRRRLIQEGNANSCLVQVTLETTNPDVSPFFHSEALSLTSFANIINDGGIDPSDISITTPGNHLNAANIVVTFSAPTGVGGVLAVANVTSLNGNSVNSINITYPGVGYLTSPTITISEPGAPSNATAVVTGEDQTSGGNGYARYITRPITLASGFAAGDLQIFLQAIRPQGTDIAVYYKVLSSADTDDITQKTWQLMTKANDIYSPDQQTAINLNYNTGYNSLGVPRGSASYVYNGITYPIGGTFQSFMLKIVLTANDPTVPPEVQSLRGIAVPAG